VASVEHKADCFSLGNDGTALFGHQDHFHGHHSRLNGRPASSDYDKRRIIAAELKDLVDARMWFALAAYINRPLITIRAIPHMEDLPRRLSNNCMPYKAAKIICR
jgi:hypothetical protein